MLKSDCHVFVIYHEAPCGELIRDPIKARMKAKALTAGETAGARSGD